MLEARAGETTPHVKKSGQARFQRNTAWRLGEGGISSMSFRACWLAAQEAAQEADNHAAEIHRDPSDFSPIELGSKRSESISVDLTPQRVKRQKTAAAATAVSNLHPISDSCAAHCKRPPTIDKDRHGSQATGCEGATHLDPIRCV